MASCLFILSAGIGRTGTYIAIDALHKEVQQENKINIAEYVKKMREKRMNMVQTYVNRNYVMIKKIRTSPFLIVKQWSVTKMTSFM